MLIIVHCLIDRCSLSHCSLFVTLVSLKTRVEIPSSGACAQRIPQDVGRYARVEGTRRAMPQGQCRHHSMNRWMIR